MSQISVLLVDKDETYLSALEKKFIDEFGDQANLNLITDESYLNQFFSTPQNMDILIIDENLYNQEFQKHNIRNTFLLTETQNQNTTENLSKEYKSIYKYTSIKEIFNEVLHNSDFQCIEQDTNKSNTKTIMVYSPIGGIGTTSVAVGLSAALARNHKRILYVNLESLQSFNFIFTDKEYLKSGYERKISEKNENTYQNIKPYIKKELFDYVPPLSRALTAFSITIYDYLNLIEKAKVSGDYEIIIIDIPSIFDDNIPRLMSDFDKIIIVIGQDKVSVSKIDCLIKNIDCSETNKFKFVCNKYKEGSENLLVSEYITLRVNDYIEFEENMANISIENLSQKESFKTLAFSYI